MPCALHHCPAGDRSPHLTLTTSHAITHIRCFYFTRHREAKLLLQGHRATLRQTPESGIDPTALTDLEKKNPYWFCTVICVRLAQANSENRKDRNLRELSQPPAHAIHSYLVGLLLPMATHSHWWLRFPVSSHPYPSTALGKGNDQHKPFPWSFVGNEEIPLLVAMCSFGKCTRARGFSDLGLVVVVF